MKKGFTLVELLVVIAIIAILSGILAISYQGYLKSARDGKRKTDLEQIRSALEMYRADCNTYPVGAVLRSEDYLTCNGVTYIQLPQDPLSPGFQYRLRTDSTGNSYSLCASLERGGGTVSANCAGATTCGVACNYEVFNP